MSHYPEEDIHVTRNATYVLRSDPDANKAANQLDSATFRVESIGSFTSDVEDTDDGVVLETTIEVPGDTVPGNYTWQQWITTLGESFPVAGGSFIVEKDIEAV